MTTPVARLWARLPFTGRLLFTASIALIIAGGTMLYSSARRDAEEAQADLRAALTAELSTLPASLAEIVVIGDFSTLQQTLERHVTRQEIAHITFHDISGTTIESADRQVALAAPQWFVRWLGVEDRRGTTETLIGGRSYGTLEITLTARPAINRSWQRLKSHLSILALAVLLDFLGIWLVLRSGLRPLRALDASARALAQGEFTSRIAPQGSPELRRSITAFNQMADAIQRAHEVLGQEKEKWRITLNSIGDAVIATDGVERIEFMNPEAERLTGWSAQEGIGQRLPEILRLIDELSGASKPSPVEEAITKGHAINLANHTLLLAKDGQSRPIADSAAPIRLATDGTIIGAVMVFRDETRERRRLEQLRAVAEQRRLTASVFENTHEGILITDPQGKIIEVNAAFSRITGYDREEVLGRNPRLLKSGYHEQEFFSAMWQVLTERGYWSSEIWNRRKDGEVYPELLTISAVHDENGEVTHYVGVATDITLIKQHEQQLERIAHHDSLTGIPNRVLLADRMRQSIAQTRRSGHLMAVGYLDLDGFKPINDSFGHEAGDQLLIEVAGRMESGLRDGDTVARLGGDEFVFLLLGLRDIHECEQTVTRLLSLIAQPIALGPETVTISASIGVSIYPTDDADPDTLLRHADQAMYLAKQAGRNRYHLYDPEHDRRARSQREALERITQGLAVDEFELFYQPKVNMRSGEVVGAEALIRWRHPERGLLAPADFLPLLEGSDEALALGEWVLATALYQVATWHRQGLNLGISVNIAAQHIQQQTFATRLQELLAQYPDLPRGSVQLEVLETAALEDIGRVSRIIDACRQLGVGFALDDFGTGYSSLTYLKRLPAEALKIDQSFVRDMLKDPEDLAIVEGVVALANAFGRSVIAEGVESLEHCLRLMQLGCDIAQGYGIARPMPAAQIPQWVAAWRPDPRWQQEA